MRTTLMGLDLDGRDVLVAGGGPVAARRAARLVADGAVVTVVSPLACEDLLDLVDTAAVRWVEREVEEADVEDCWLVVAATGDRSADERLCGWAADRRVWSVCAGSASTGTARTPAVVDHAGMRVGVVSHGVADPRRVAGLRDALAEHLHTAPLDLRARREASRAGGRVVLVGGGPGADDLISLRGRRVLSEADVVVTDRLGPTGLLDLLPDDVEVVDVGKTPGRHQVSQEQINAILVDHATRGRTVVRLKGGDPYVFGRGGEEHAHCTAHGIPVEVVPGVSSAVGAPATVGIPLIHRGTVGGFHVAHGHAELDAASVACVVDASATLVLLMGVATLPDQVTRLLAAGADPHTPVAVIENATLPAQRVVRAPLSGIVTAADECAVRAPAVVVIGRVADPGLLDAPDGPSAPRESSAATSAEPPWSTPVLSPAAGARR